LKNSDQLISRVAELYSWLDKQIQVSELEIQGRCNACGDCCDFDSYGHRLYVTPPELVYLAEKTGQENLKPMTGARCPYQVADKCTIRLNRFASCRIFFCKSNAEKQSELSEEMLKKLKALCIEFDLPYRYSELKTALKVQDAYM
jgi:Fe-S-cluster containining protein